MRPHGGLCEIGIRGAQRIDDPLVLGERLLRAAAFRQGEPAHAVERCPRGVEQPDRARHLQRAEDRRMQRLVEIIEPGEVLRLQRTLLFQDVRIEKTLHRGIDRSRGSTHRFGFEAHADEEALTHVGRANSGDEAAVLRKDVNQAFFGKPCDRLADGRARDAERDGDLLFPQRRARRQYELADATAQVGINALGLGIVPGIKGQLEAHTKMLAWAFSAEKLEIRLRACHSNMSIRMDLVVQQTDLSVRLHPADNVAVAAARLVKGVAIDGGKIIAAEDIAPGHKIATEFIRKGEVVRKYGQVIGVATQDIPAGAHVHLHNLAVSDRREEAAAVRIPNRIEPPRHFMGYRRANGRVGVRNYIGVLTSVNCSATVARHIAEAAARSNFLDAYSHIDGIVPITHTSGCGMTGSGESFELLRRTLWGTAANPNFGAILLVGLGCEVIQIERLKADFGLDESATLQSFTIQETGGTHRAIAEGLARLETMLPAVDSVRRSECPASELVVGLQCGGSDGWSGITSNPALGNASDRLVALGGTVILSETPEIYGAEHLLYARAKDSSVSAKLRARLDWWENYTRIHGAEMNNNPSPGNKAGGLTTILEKSLGAVAKSGTSTLNDVIKYAEPVRARGFVFMDSPGFDPCSATGQVASGATMIAFTTGRGSAYGCKPSPSIKLASNTDLYARMADDIDIDCGPIARGLASIEEKGAEILGLLLEVASGKKSKSEELGYGGMEFVPWLTGAVM